MSFLTKKIMKNQKRKNQKGFTLIELLAALVILTAIMGIAIPSITSSLERTKAKQDKIKYKILETAAELYVTDHKNAIYNKLNSASKCYISLNLLDTLDENKQNSNGEDFNGVIVFTKPNQYEYKEDYTEIISCT